MISEDLLERDVRNIVIPQECFYIHLHSDEEFDNLWDELNYLASYYKFILVGDVLASLNQNRDFRVAENYGWKTGIFFFSADRATTDYKGNWIIKLPPPRKIEKEDWEK